MYVIQKGEFRTPSLLEIPKAIEAAVIVSRARRTGTAVQSFRAVAGSSEVAMVAAAPPVKIAVAAKASFARLRHRDRVVILPPLFSDKR